MPKTTTSKTFKNGDVSVQITVTDAHNMSAKKKTAKSTKKSTRRRKRKSDRGERMFYDE